MKGRKIRNYKYQTQKNREMPAPDSEYTFI